MKASAQSLCNNILSRAHEEKIEITPMKLQKILYYVCVKYVKETGIFPIYERFEVWKYGPVIPSVYSEFKTFGASPIKGFACNAKKKSMMVDEDANPILKSCIDYVWNKLKTYDGVDLAKRTHQKGGGWRSAYQNGNEIISTEEMKCDETL
jgi:uncharacterized phage-associated protein